MEIDTTVGNYLARQITGPVAKSLIEASHRIFAKYDPLLDYLANRKIDVNYLSTYDIHLLEKLMHIGRPFISSARLFDFLFSDVEQEMSPDWNLIHGFADLEYDFEQYIQLGDAEEDWNSALNRGWGLWDVDEPNPQLQALTSDVDGERLNAQVLNPDYVEHKGGIFGGLASSNPTDKPDIKQIPMTDEEYFAVLLSTIRLRAQPSLDTLCDVVETFLKGDTTYKVEFQFQRQNDIVVTIPERLSAYAEQLQAVVDNAFLSSPRVFIEQSVLNN